MTRKEVIGELRELKHMFQRSYGKYPTCLEEAIDYIYQTPRWIPCSERYPEPDERVLVTDGYCYYVWDCMSNRGDAYFWEDESGYYHNKYDVVAWMPLPEPYKEGK